MTRKHECFVWQWFTLERPNPAWLSIFIHYQQPLLNTSCPLAQVDNLLRVTIVFMLFFHKPGLKFVKLHHCLTMCQSKGNCQMEQLSPNLAPGNEITHRPQSHVKSLKKRKGGKRVPWIRRTMCIHETWLSYAANVIWRLSQW